MLSLKKFRFNVQAAILNSKIPSQLAIKWQGIIINTWHDIFIILKFLNPLNLMDNRQYIIILIILIIIAEFCLTSALCLQLYFKNY